MPNKNKNNKGERRGNNYKKIILILIVAIVVLALIFVAKNYVTGNATGISLGSPKRIGTTTSQSIAIGADITKKLCAGAYTTEAAALITSAANKYNGGLKGAIQDAIGMPSYELPDIYGVLAGVASAFNEAPSTKCLKDIGKAYCGKDWTGIMYVTFNIGKGSYIYPDWQYYYERVRYVGGGVDCSADLGCAFSYNPKTNKMSDSCFG